MSELNVKIVKLEPMQVISMYGFGQGPEGQAWDKLRAWLEQKGMMADLKAHRFFGFNNPNPAPGSPNYGYEQWMTVGPEVVPEGDVRVKDFGGGLYAMTRCKLPVITETWKKLVIWREGSAYRPATHQWLEECLTPFVPDEDIEFDIYLPIME
jgi:AraC family transcriptional regulator